jgi:hypothetical protein
VGLPQPTTVRDPDTGIIVDGYRVRVQSDETGAQAVLDIPRDRYSPEYVQRQANQHLGTQDAVVKLFGTPEPGQTG